MADEHDDSDFQQASSGASTSYPAQAGSLKKNGFVVINDRPCKIIEISTSKTGKHGHAKAHIVAVDIFTQKKMEENCPTSHNMMCPNVTRQDYQLLDISGDGFASLLLGDGSTKDDLKLPEGELGDQIKKDFEDGKDLTVTVLSSMNEEAIIASKESSN